MLFVPTPEIISFDPSQFVRMLNMIENVQEESFLMDWNQAVLKLK